MANIRADALHKATSDLASRYEIIVAEDLNVSGMLRNRKVARAVADQGFGQAVRLLGYKTTWNGGKLMVADRWFPSSKTCSGCGAVKAKLSLSERTYVCTGCGLILDRDVNAARNLLHLAVSGTREAKRLRSPGKTRPRRAQGVEAGIRHQNKTGTASGQPLAAIQEFTNAH